MDTSVMGCEAKALQHCLPDEALSIVAPGFGREFDEPSLWRTGAMPPYLGSAAMRFELRRPLAPGRKQKRIHGLS